MKASTSSVLPSSRANYVQRRKSPLSASVSSSTSASGSSSATSTSMINSPHASRARLAALPPRHPQHHQLPSPTKPVAVSKLAKNTDQAIRFERELQNLLETEYRDDVEEYMYEMETRTMASVELIDMQPELQWYMRPYLIDFLIEIHQQHALRSETLYLAVNIVDRYVSKRIVFKKHYQLVGCAALWIAAKFEDAKDRVPTVQELAAACCHAYEESAFVQMEGHVLSTIGWMLGHPTAEAWLRLASVGYGLEEQRVQHVSRFIMEVTLFHRAFVAFKPSDIAVSCLLLARYMLGKPRRPEYETEEIMRIVTLIDSHLGEHLDQVSAIVVRKYSFAFYSRSSTIAREWYLSGNRFRRVLSSPSPSTSSSHLSSSPSRASSFANRSSSPLTSPSSEASFDSSDACSDFDDETPEPLTPITPLSACSLVDPMDCSPSCRDGSVKTAGPLAVQQSWDGTASMRT